ncbi:MAG TPA: hypothetical protein VKQ36_16870, partial [Ktedonobacterales bacterium]|nr:hypothetical protein [Ktedonobacterales bacterium]
IAAYNEPILLSCEFGGMPDRQPPEREPRSATPRLKTSDLVRAVVPATSVKAGVYVGRLAVRATGSCNLKAAAETIQGAHVRYCQPLQRGDGYNYSYGYPKGGAALPPHS